MTKTMLELAFEILDRDNEVDFDNLWSAVSKEATLLDHLEDHTKKFQMEQKAVFYKLLVLDGRFIRTTEGNWTLIKNHSLIALKKMKAFYAKEEIKE